MTKKYALGFTSLEQEVTLDSIEIVGICPDWLTGSLLRAGPAKFEVGEHQIEHWFDGFAMLHKFSFTHGKVSYANKFLQTNFYRNALKQGSVKTRGFATDPCKSIFKRFTSLFSPNSYDNGNVNVTLLANKFLALTETPLAVEFDANTLETFGIFDFHDAIGTHTTTAHPHIDFTTGESFNYSLSFGRNSLYQIYRIPRNSSERACIAKIPVSLPSYIHSFAITEHYIMLVAYPLQVNPLHLLFSSKSFIENFKWLPENGTRVFVVSRADGSVREFTAPPIFCFHHVNAYEQGQEIILDLVSYKDASIIKALYLDVLRNNFAEKFSLSRLERISINLANGAVTSKILSSISPELPRINYARNNMKPYTYAYAVGQDRDEFLNKLLKINVNTGDALVWQEEGCYPSEPVFVEKPGASSEDEGVILSVVLDTKNQNSFLLMLDAQTFTPLGRAIIPHHIPFGFHGNHYNNI